MASSPRQIRRPKRRPQIDGALGVPKPGLTVDAYGSEAVDPTENVLALVDAQAKFQEKYDELTAKFNAAEQAWIIKYFEGLASMKERYDKQISETQTTQLKTTSDLVSATQTKMEGSLSTSINKAVENITAQFNTMNERLSRVEQFRYETGGRSSVSDPAMAQIASDLKALNAARDQGTGRHEQSAATTAIILALVAASIGAVSIVINLLEYIGKAHG
jgi:hypothetical protein